MSEFTPGPWRYDGEEGVKAGNRNIAAIYVASDYTWMDGNELPFQDECIANAHLIAAAPNLLAALEAMNAVATFPQWSAGDCRLCRYDFQTGHAAGCPYTQAEALMVAAIAKARGF